MKITTFFRIEKLTLLVLVLFSACHKKEFLEKKPSSNLVVPSSLSDFQALLDNDAVMNVVPALGDISADNYYIDYSFWMTQGSRIQNAYIWATNVFPGQEAVEDWNYPYQQVYYANVVLDGLNDIKVTGDNLTQWNTVKGEALFYRAFAFYNLAQVFTKGYDTIKAATDLGIPVRLTSYITAPSTRTTVKATYNQITSDLRIALDLLPANVAMNSLSRPTRPAAQAMLARVYLSMHKYDSARMYANNALQSNSGLLNYNSLTKRAIPANNVEILFQAKFTAYDNYDMILQAVVFPQILLDSTLALSYADSDMRRIIFYDSAGRASSKDSLNLRSNYSGNIFPFGGLATDELYLIRAECNARFGQYSAAVADWDALLSNRIRPASFVGHQGMTGPQLLDSILLERRKEMPFRGLRWTDIQRLNNEGANITLTRKLNGTTYTLVPKSNLYALPIPPDVISLGGIQQNPRP